MPTNTRPMVVNAESETVEKYCSECATDTEWVVDFDRGVKACTACNHVVRF